MPIVPLTYKVSLLLDLDETTFIALSEAEFALHGATEDGIKSFKKIHPKHILSKPEVHSGFYFFVLNPEKLKKMLEAIYGQGDNVVIFTSGLWLPGVLPIVARLCGLAEETALLFQQARFLNPQHDGEKLGLSVEATRYLLKGYRLHGLFRPVPELRNHHFVLLDNEMGHIESCKHSNYIEGVHACIQTEDTGFYDLVLQQMQMARLEGAITSPARSVYAFPKEVFNAFLSIESSIIPSVK